MHTEEEVKARESFGERLRWLIEQRLGWTHTAFARELEVPRSQLSRWITRPGMLPSERYLQRMAELGGVSAAWLRYGADAVPAPVVEDDVGAGGAVEDELAAEDLFRHFEALVRRMGGADVAPEELRLRKLDVVEGLFRLYAAQGTVPGWVYTLKGRVLREEL